MNDHVRFHGVYDLKCSCGYSYMKRIDRSLETRFLEHLSKLFIGAMDKSKCPSNLFDRHPASSAAKHLTDSGYKIKTSKAFSILYGNNERESLHLIKV